MADRPFAYVCSPYKGDTEANAARAREYSRQVFEAGYCPVTPHLLFPQFLKDDNPAEREAGMEMGGQLLAQCRALVVCGAVISEGMAREIRLAEQLRVPVLTLDVFLPETARERPPAASPALLEQIAAARVGRVAEPEPERRSRKKDEEIGMIHVDVANPFNRLPWGDAESMLKLPVTKEEFDAALRSIGIGGKYTPSLDFYFSNVHSWDDNLRKHIPRDIDDHGFNELNYLAAKLNALSDPQREVFRAVMESGRHCGSAKDIINVTENLNDFDLLPFHSAKDYGDFLGLCGGDEHSEAISRLMESDDDCDHALYEYITGLETHIDSEAYGRFRAEEEDGVFTEYGYLRGGEEFREVYTGVQDIPAEYRVAAFPETERTQQHRSSVLKRIAADRAERAAAQEKASPDKTKSRGPEL